MSVKEGYVFSFIGILDLIWNVGCLQGVVGGDELFRNDADSSAILNDILSIASKAIC